jgi:hypothetical protein
MRYGLLQVLQQMERLGFSAEAVRAAIAANCRNQLTATHKLLLTAKLRKLQVSGSAHTTEKKKS